MGHDRDEQLRMHGRVHPHSPACEPVTQKPASYVNLDLCQRGALLYLEQSQRLSFRSSLPMTPSTNFIKNTCGSIVGTMQVRFIISQPTHNHDH